MEANDGPPLSPTHLPVLSVWSKHRNAVSLAPKLEQRVDALFINTRAVPAPD